MSSTSTATATGSHDLSRSSSTASSVATTNSFLPVIKQEDLFSASFVLSAVADAERAAESPPRAPYLRPVSTFHSPALPSAAAAGMRSSDTLARVDSRSSTATSPTTQAPSLPPTRPLVISHYKRSIRSRLSLSRGTQSPAAEQAEVLKSKRAFSLPFNLPSHSTLSLAPSSNLSIELPTLLDEAKEDEAASSWVPPPPPVIQGPSEAPVRGKGGPGWCGGKRINDKGEIVQVDANGVETVIMRLPQKAAPVHPAATPSASSTPALPPVLEHTHASQSSRKHSASSSASGSSDTSSTSSLFDSYSEGASSRSSFSSSKSSSGDHHAKEGNDSAAKPVRPHRHRSAKILSTLKAQHSAEKLELSNALDESKEAVEALKAENSRLREECRELRTLVLDIRRVIQGDTFVGLGIANLKAPLTAPPRPSPEAETPTETDSSLLPPALIHSSRSGSASSASTEDFTRPPREEMVQNDAFGGGVGRQWFEEGSSDEDDEDDHDVRDLIAAFPPSPTSLPSASPPPAMPLPPTPSFGFRPNKTATASTQPKGHKSSGSLSSLSSRIPMMPRTKRTSSTPKLVIGHPQGFRAI